CADWQNFGSTPDYYHTCGFDGMNIPDSYRGYQYAHSGQGMAGIITWMDPNACCSPNFREYIGAALTSSLQPGTKYFMSFYINFSGYPQGWLLVAANNMGLRFSTVASDENNMPPLNNFAHLKTDVIYKDTMNWLKISGSFVADSAYKYVVIGNFYDDAKTDTGSIAGPYSGSETAYYYIDDVCVTTDSVYNMNYAIGLKENSVNTGISFFPNPASNNIYLTGNSVGACEVVIYNDLGVKVKEVRIKEERFDVSDLANGIYSFQITSGTHTETKRVVIRK
ncbi:MAG: hypothetical protein K0S12_2423, partial [Bacteroidetes bacterium]|nr:hypothetical protein [Bacteroidota bacterium]